MTKKQVFDAKTGISTVSDMTAEEEAQVLKDRATQDKDHADKITADAQAVTDNASAISKLEALGLSSAEIESLKK